VKVLVFGASGATGRHIVAQAHERGHEVVAFTRGEFATEDFPPHDRSVFGDATSPSDVDAAIAYRPDVIISALGARSLKKTYLLETAVTIILAAMRQNGISRLIKLGAAGTFGLPKMSRLSIPERLTFELLRRTLLRHSFDDHAAADRLIQRSQLDWTIVQPPELSNGPPRGYCVALNGISRGGSIARADVATAILDIMEAGSFVRQSPFVFRPPNAR